MTTSRTSHPHRTLHRYAVVAATATFLLLIAGSLVTSADSEESVEALYEKGATLLDGWEGGQDVLTQAANDFEQIAKQDPQSAYGPLGLSRVFRARAYLYGNVYDQERLRKDALPLALEAKQREPGLRDVHTNLANIYAMLGQYPEAEAEAYEALRLAPYDGVSQLVLGQVLDHQGKLLEAVQRYETALSYPMSPELQTTTLLRLGNAYRQLNNPRQSIEVFHRALSIRERSPWVYYGLGLAYLDLGDYELALEAFERAVALSPFPLARSCVAETKGHLAVKAGKREEAITWFKEASAIIPDRAATHVELGELYYEGGELEKARAHFRRVVELAPKVARSYEYLSTIAERLDRDYEGALTYAKQALERNPASAWAYHQAGWALELLGRRDEALVHYRKSLELDSSSERAGRLKQKIEEFR